MLLTVRTKGEGGRIRGRHIFGIVLLGLTGVAGYNALFFKGLTIIQASRAAIIIATCPAVIAIASVALGERLALRKVTGVIVSLTGAVIVISRGNPSELLAGAVGTGEILLLLCVLCWTFYSLVGRKMMKELPGLKLVAYSNVVGTLALFPLAWMEVLSKGIGHFSPKIWLCIIYMAVLATVVGCIWYYEGIKKIGTVKAGLFINLIPVWAIVFSFFILEEPVTISLLAGAVLVIGGVYLTNRISIKKAA